MPILLTFICAVIVAKLIVKFCVPKEFTFQLGKPTITTTTEYIRPEIPLEMNAPYAEAKAMETGEPFIHILVETKAKGNKVKSEVKVKSFRNFRINCEYCGTEINIDKDKVCPHCGSDYSAKEIEEAKNAKIQMVVKASEEKIDAAIRAYSNRNI